MHRIVALVALCIALAGCVGPAALQNDSVTPVYSPPAGSIVLRVEVLSVEFTDWSTGCGTVDNCIPVYFWYRYRARVKDVVAGTWAEPEVEFMHLQHAEYIRDVTEDCYVVLRPAGADLGTMLGVPLVADRILSQFWRRDKAAIKALRDGA